jgi:hypothetical protein
MSSKRPRVEEFQVTGAQLVSSVKDLVHEGNIRRISIRNSAGVTLLEIPLVLGLAGAVFVPVWAALGALAALVANCTLAVERIEGTVPRPADSKPRAAKSKHRRRNGRGDTA